VKEGKKEGHASSEHMFTVAFPYYGTTSLELVLVVSIKKGARLALQNTARYAIGCMVTWQREGGGLHAAARRSTY